MYLNAYFGKEAAGMYHSFGKVDRNTVVKYIWWERHAEMNEEDDLWHIEQKVFKRVSNEPGRRWQEVSSKTKIVPCGKKARFELSLIENRFTANWPKYDEPFLKCAISY